MATILPSITSLSIPFTDHLSLSITEITTTTEIIIITMTEIAKSTIIPKTSGIRLRTMLRTKI